MIYISFFFLFIVCVHVSWTHLASMLVGNNGSQFFSQLLLNEDENFIHKKCNVEWLNKEPTFVGERTRNIESSKIKIFQCLLDNMNAIFYYGLRSSFHSFFKRIP